MPAGLKKITGWHMAIVFLMSSGGTLWVSNNVIPSTPVTLDGELEAIGQITAQAFTLELQRRCNDEALRQEMLDNWPQTLQPLAAMVPESGDAQFLTHDGVEIGPPVPANVARDVVRRIESPQPSPADIHAALTDQPVTLRPFGEYVTVKEHGGYSMHIPPAHRHHCPHGCGLPGDLVNARVFRCPACLRKWTVGNWAHLKRRADGYRFPHEIQREQEAIALGYPDAAAMHREQSYKYELEQAVNTLVTLLEQR